MVRCVDCHNLVNVFFPTEIKGVWSDARWRCAATGQVFPGHWLVEIERMPALQEITTLSPANHQSNMPNMPMLFWGS